MYEVVTNGVIANVTSPTTTFTFTAPALVGIFTGTVTVVVTAVNRFGAGFPSGRVNVAISKLIVI